MTVQNPALFINDTTADGEDLRRWIAAHSYSGGIVGYGDLKVTEKSGTPNMSVDVAGGRIFIPGSEATYQGTYFGENRGTTNLAIAASDPTNPRKDLIVAKVQDSAYSGGTDAWSLAVVTGIPAAVPAEPTAPANSITLAMVDVLAAASSITNARITDRRVYGGRSWSEPWGRVGQYTTQSLNQNPGTGSLADVTSASVTFTAVANRLYRATYQVANYDSGGAGLVRHVLTDASNNLLVSGRNRSAVANTEQACTLVSPTFTPSAGSYTVKARAQSITVTTNSFVYAAADTWLVLTVDDVGPASTG